MLLGGVGSAPLGRVSRCSAWKSCLAVLLGRVASAALGRVARVNAGRTAVATGDRGGLHSTNPVEYRWSFFYCSAKKQADVGRPTVHTQTGVV